jgi:hypothetical protein
MPRDPISNREYEQSIEGFKIWAEHELPHGLPLLYAVVGFVTISSLFTVAVATFAWLTAFSVPTWGWAVIPTFGLIWAHGGWIHGRKAQVDIPEEPHIDSEWRY